MCRTLISFLWSNPFLLPLSHNSTCSILKSIHFCLLVVVTSGRHLTNFSVLFNYFADYFTGVELDALRTSIDTLRARLRRFTQSSKGDVANQQRKIGGRNYALDAQISQLKSSIAKLSLLNSENTKKVKLVESVLKNQESSR